MKNTEDLEGEVWVTHPIGIKVSNLGRVETRIKGKWYGSNRGNGYLQVRWKGKVYSIHRLICETFKDNPNNYKEVDHINRDKTDNRACNLRWVDHSMQMKNREVDYKMRTEKIDYKTIAEKRSIPILQLNKDTLEVVKEWKSTMEAQRESRFNSSHITDCCRGNRKTHKGYVWRYKKSEVV